MPAKVKQYHNLVEKQIFQHILRALKIILQSINFN